VLKQHPEGVQGLPGYVWLDMPEKVRSVGEHELEFTHELPSTENYVAIGSPMCASTVAHIALAWRLRIDIPGTDP
jgi:hypothetical protein